MAIFRLLPMAALCGLFATGAHAGSCLAPDRLSQLESREMSYLLGRIPPAFRHAVEDRRVIIRMRVDETAPAGVCMIKETLTIPQAEIAEASQVLDHEPARRILLFSQGYSLPSEPNLEASFAVAPGTLEIDHQDVLQVGSLGKLRASVEMMYAMLSQARAEMKETAGAVQPWSEEFKNRTTEACLTRFRSNGNLRQACQCRTEDLEKQYSERRLDNLEYVLSNPYAKATGAAKDYATEQDSINARCKLSPA